MNSDMIEFSNAFSDKKFEYQQRIAIWLNSLLYFIAISSLVEFGMLSFKKWGDKFLSRKQKLNTNSEEWFYTYCASFPEK